MCIRDSRRTAAPRKKRRLRRSFLPLAGKLFSVTEIVSGNGKHSLLCPEHEMFSGHKGLPFAEAVPPRSPASTKRRNRKDRNRFTGQRYRPMQSVVCQQAAQTYAKPAPNGATNVRGRTLRVPEGVSLPLRTIGNDTLRRFITDVRKAYRRVCADTRHL